jgi:molybdopterin molybdotransferase
MIYYPEALNIIREIGAAKTPQVEHLPLFKALGRILAQSIASPEDVPSFTNSAMDGFAVSSKNTLGATHFEPIRLPVHGLVAAGDLMAFEKANQNGLGVAAEIMTGAPLPTNRYDAVVRIEDVNVIRNRDGHAEFIEISKPIQALENVRPLGTDFKKGQLVLPKDIRITPEHLLACTSLGITTLPVKKLPRVVVLSTGSELMPPDTATLPPGMIRNSTGPFLCAAFLRLGIEAQYLGVVRDEPDHYRKILEKVLQEGADLIISTGAVSMGKYDFVSDVLKELGAKTYFHKVAIRPGKPLLFGEFDGPIGRRCAFFGVPGNPVSTAVGLRFFIEPYLRAWLGLSSEQSIRATLTQDCKKPEGLRCFFKGKASLGKNGFEVEALKGQASYVVSSLLDANCWVILSEHGSEALANSDVEVVPLQHGFEQGVFL